MILCSASSPTPYSTSCWRIKDTGAQPFTSLPLHSHRGGFLRIAEPRFLLCADRSRRRLPAEDLLPARASGDRDLVRLCDRRPDGDRSPTHTRPTLGPALLRGDPHEPDLRRRSPHHRLNLGTGLVGSLVGLERAHAGLFPDHLPLVRHLPAPALRDRGP